MIYVFHPARTHRSKEGEMSACEHTALLRRCVLIGLAVIGVIIGLSAISSGADDTEGQNATLRGLEGVHVIVGDLTPEVERAGLTRRQLQTDVELRLRKAGIPLLTSAERAKVPGKPFLAIDLYVVPRPDTMLAAYSLRVKVLQVASLETDAFTTTVSTWGVGETGSIDSARLTTLRDNVRDHIDQFINAYLSVRPQLAGSTMISSASPRRDLIRPVQERLQTVGFNPGTIDGTMGPQTRDALRGFQNTKGIRPTGEPDEATLDALGVH
jgi:Putative peptidoglycan binding domain